MENLKKWLKIAIETLDVTYVSQKYVLTNFGIGIYRYTIEICKKDNLYLMRLIYPVGYYLSQEDSLVEKTDNKITFITNLENYFHDKSGYLRFKMFNHFYHHPIDFFYYYRMNYEMKNKFLFDKNVDFNLHDKIINIKEKRRFVFFSKDNFFINNFSVFVFETETSHSTRRRDTWNKTTKHVLVHNHIIVSDDYIKSILPKDSDEGYSEYNDSTPSLPNKQTAIYYKSDKLTEEFIKKYNSLMHEFEIKKRYESYFLPMR